MTTNDIEPVFDEPWQASAFALAVSLMESGVISREHWSRTLGDVISQEDKAYYRQWLGALEKICGEQGLVSESEINHTANRWRNAYLSTPHGQPVALKKEMT